MDDDLKTYVKFNTYIDSEDQWFDEKLLYAMPHKPDKPIDAAITEEAIAPVQQHEINNLSDSE